MAEINSIASLIEHIEAHHVQAEFAAPAARKLAEQAEGEDLASAIPGFEQGLAGCGVTGSQLAELSTDLFCALSNYRRDAQQASDSLGQARIELERALTVAIQAKKAADAARTRATSFVF